MVIYERFLFTSFSTFCLRVALNFSISSRSFCTSWIYLQEYNAHRDYGEVLTDTLRSEQNGHHFACDKYLKNVEPCHREHVEAEKRVSDLGHNLEHCTFINNCRAIIVLTLQTLSKLNVLINALSLIKYYFCLLNTFQTILSEFGRLTTRWFLYHWWIDFFPQWSLIGTLNRHTVI